MSTPEFSIQFPVFALKQGIEKYVSCDLSDTRPRGKGNGLLIFTTEEKATEFLTSANYEAQVIRLERESVFRMLLQRLRDKCLTVLFDADFDRWGFIRAAQRHPAAEVMERFLHSSGHRWDYPLYVLRTIRGACACVDITRNCERFRMVAVYTDWDLADRGVLVRPTPHTAVPIEDEKAFARFVREMPPHIAGVVYDPQPLPDGRPTRVFVLLREELLAALETEL